MTIDINQFWSLLSESQLVSVPQTQILFSQFSAEPSIPKTAESLAQYLVAQNAISPYQSQILIAGHHGPFRYGNYTVIERIESGPIKGHFRARHTKTGYIVLLSFFAGTEQSHLKAWQEIEARIEQTSKLQHPNVAETFETVALPDHRFVVSQLPSGVALHDKLPRKARLPWKKACTLMAQAAKGLEQIHKLDVVHNAISPRTIWLEKNSLVQIRLSPVPDPDFELTANNEKGSESKFDYAAPELLNRDNQLVSENTPASDLYSLGCTLYRVIAGRTPFPEPDLDRKKKQIQSEPPEALTKYELPAELESLILSLLAKHPAERPKSAAEVANLLALLSGKAAEINSITMPVSNPRAAFRKSLVPMLPGAKVSSVALAPEIATEPELDPETATERSVERLAKIQVAAQSAQKRKQNKWRVPAAVAAGLLALSGFIAVLAMTANKVVVEKPEKPTTPETQTVDATNPEDLDPAFDPELLSPTLRPTVFQQLIQDDDASLWETPTNGPPIEFSYLPTAPKILFVGRPSEIVGSDEGQRVIKSLGPKFEGRIKSFVDRSGLDLENIEQLIVSLHTNSEFEYEPYFIVTTCQPVDASRLMQNWNRPARRRLENQQEVFDSADGQTAYYVLHDALTRESTSETEETTTDESSAHNPGTEAATEDPSREKGITRFAFGNKQLIDEVALSLGASALSGSLGNLAEWTDGKRHFNVLFLRNALFNDEGQKLMGREQQALNRQLSLMIPDEVRGGLISFHLDSGSYFELMLDKNVDLKARDLESIMSNEFRSRRDQLMLFVAQIPSSPYWDNVRIRYSGMLANFSQNLRWDVEHGQVVANCWLPPMAAHNLIAATEHVISFSAGVSTAAIPVLTGPQSLEELLATKRSLDIANPPDLNVLMADLQTEITDDLGKLPFAFNIRLMGADLEKDGITKNQRPSELVINQKSLAEILTSIMISANPDKDISGPSDPGCKLIWVVADDPLNPGEKAILITTRAAAAAKSYEIPMAFRAQQESQ